MRFAGQLAAGAAAMLGLMLPCAARAELSTCRMIEIARAAYADSPGHGDVAKMTLIVDVADGVATVTFRRKTGPNAVGASFVSYGIDAASGKILWTKADQ